MWRHRLSSVHSATQSAVCTTVDQVQRSFFRKSTGRWVCAERIKDKRVALDMQTSEWNKHRATLIARQGGRCAICGK